MDDEELSGMARDYEFLCETAINGPWKIDAFKRNLIREEFCQRGQGCRCFSFMTISKLEKQGIGFGWMFDDLLHFADGVVNSDWPGFAPHNPNPMDGD